MYRKGGKRLFDCCAAAAGLILLAPLFIVLALLIRWRMGSPVFFRQRRPGLKGEIFEIIKFRTMRDARDREGKLLSDGERLTRLGKFLRGSSLDELPELINVFRGEMSLVGPRPLLPEYLDRYTPEQARRHDVRPGITGWAQVNGRQNITLGQRVEYDVWYVEHCSMMLDLKILFRTLKQAFFGHGVRSGEDLSPWDDLPPPRQRETENPKEAV